jgi:Ca2+-binding EF-hand superfamily protein
MMICNGTYLALALLWLGLGYVDMIIIYSLQRKCYVILEHLLNPSHFFPPTNSDNDYGGIEERPTEKLMEEGRGAGDGGPKGGADASAKTSAGEGTSLLGGDDVTILKTGHIADMVQDVLVHDFDAVLDENTHSSLVVRLKKARLDLPLWVNVDVDQQEQSWLSYLSLGPAVPNKQEALFWGDKIGRDVNIYILRVHLIVQSIYFSILVCFFIPFTFEDYGYWGIPYTVAGLLPFFVQYFGFYPHLVMQMSLVASSGLFKEKKMVTEVIRTQKLAKLMRLLMLMTKLRATKKPAMDAGEATPKKAYDMNDPKVRAEIDEISKIFDMYDEDNSGEVEIDELANMFRSFGISLNETEMKEMFVTLDADNSGSVSKEELIDWKMGQETHDKASEMKNMAKEIFEMFDTDGSGEITVEEFKRGLEQFHSGLTHGEIMEIAQDLDESGDGNISLDEFEKAIEQALE